MVIIKPHHFYDIIKLYGAGLDKFVPDERFNHDFYKIGNMILEDKDLNLKLTKFDDAICSPCIYINEHGICIDKINHIESIKSKEEFNKMLDNKIMDLLELSEGDIIKSKVLCRRIYEIKELTKTVWNLEEEIITDKRENFFNLGAEKYLK